MGKPPTTLRDIAKSLGTSIGTVHRALHDNPGVSAATKGNKPQQAANDRHVFHEVLELIWIAKLRVPNKG